MGCLFTVVVADKLNNYLWLHLIMAELVLPLILPHKVQYNIVYSNSSFQLAFQNQSFHDAYNIATL